MSDRIDITPAGNVGIGTSSPSYLPTVNGTAYAAGGPARYPIGVTNLISRCSMRTRLHLARLKPVTFVWKEPKDDGMRGRQIGFVAQGCRDDRAGGEAVLTMNRTRRRRSASNTTR